MTGEAGRLTSGLARLIFPDHLYCLCCGRVMDPRFEWGICGNCGEYLHWADDLICEKCGRPLSKETGSGLCGVCEAGNTEFEKGCTLFAYGRAEREIMHRFKYSGYDYYGRELAKLLHLQIQRRNIRADLAAPVPMFIKKERERGYNQASVLGKPLAAYMKIPWTERLLIRAKETEAMSGLRREEREANVAGAFALSESTQEMIRGRNVLLVDDIMTTGSTLSACSRVLLEKGVSGVYAATAAAVADMGE